MHRYKFISIALVLTFLIVVGYFLFITHQTKTPPTFSINQYNFKRDGSNLTLDLLLGANNHNNIKQVTADLTFDPITVSTASIIPLSPHDKNPFFSEEQTIRQVNQDATHILYTISGRQMIKGIDIGKIGTVKITMQRDKMPTPLPDNSNYADGFVHTNLTMNGTVTVTTTDGKVLVNKIHEDTFAVFLPYPN